jgi:hypothetical protein
MRSRPSGRPQWRRAHNLQDGRSPTPSLVADDRACYCLVDGAGRLLVGTNLHRRRRGGRRLHDRSKSPEQGAIRIAATGSGLAERPAALLHHSRNHHGVRRPSESARCPLPEFGLRRRGHRLGQKADGLFQALQSTPVQAHTLSAAIPACRAQPRADHALRATRQGTSWARQGSCSEPAHRRVSRADRLPGGPPSPAKSPSRPTPCAADPDRTAHRPW